MENYIALEATTEIVSAYVRNNNVSPDILAEVIHRVFDAVSNVSNTKDNVVVCEEIKPSVPINKSVKEDSITCLYCGKMFQSIKQHLRKRHGMTPEQYRNHWKLPADYPITAPAYSARRSELAKDMGLGVEYRKKGK